MSRLKKTLEKIVFGRADANIRFEDLRSVLRHLEFDERIRGDHHIFTCDGIAEILNLQPRGGKAKAYQVKQVRLVISSYGLSTASDEIELAERDESANDIDSIDSDGDENE